MDSAAHCGRTIRPALATPCACICSSVANVFAAVLWTLWLSAPFWTRYFPQHFTQPLSFRYPRPGICSCTSLFCHSATCTHRHAQTRISAVSLAHCAVRGLEAGAQGNKMIVYDWLLLSIVHITHNAPNHTTTPTCDIGKIQAALPDPPPHLQMNEISQHSFPNRNNPRLEISPEAPKQNSSYIYVTDFRFRLNSQVGNPVLLYMPHVTDVLCTKKQRSGSMQKFKVSSDV